MDIKDEQIWENVLYIMKIEQIENDFRAIIFRKEKDNTLKFIEVISARKKVVDGLLERQQFSLTNKSLKIESSL